MGEMLVGAKQGEFIQMTGTEHYIYGKVDFFQGLGLGFAQNKLF